jgi:hypothetical protein
LQRFQKYHDNPSVPDQPGVAAQSPEDSTDGQALLACGVVMVSQFYVHLTQHMRSNTLQTLCLSRQVLQDSVNIQSGGADRQVHGMLAKEFGENLVFENGRVQGNRLGELAFGVGDVSSSIVPQGESRVCSAKDLGLVLAETVGTRRQVKKHVGDELERITDAPPQGILGEKLYKGPRVCH